MKKQRLYNHEPSYVRYHLSRWYGEKIGNNIVGKDTIQYDNQTLYYYDCRANGTTIWYDKSVTHLYHKSEE